MLHSRYRQVRQISVALALYVQVGYPALIVVLARLRRRPATSDGGHQLPSVTVIVAAWNEEDVIEGKLRNTLGGSYPADLLDVVVAADGSTDRTATIARSFGTDRVTVTAAPERLGKSAAVDKAWTLARGEIVVFSDANNLYHADTIRRLVAPFHDPSVGAVSGAKTTASGPEELALAERLYWRYENLIKQAEARVGSCVAAAGEILAVRRHLLEPLPEGRVLDDFVRVLSVLKRGYRVSFVADALSIEATSATLSDESARRARSAGARWRLLAAPRRFPLGRPVVMWQILSHKLGRLFLPLLGIAALVANVAEVATGRRSRSRRRVEPVVVLGLQVGFYVLSAVPAGRLRGPIAKAARLARYLVVTNLASLRGLLTLVGDGGSPLWAKVERHREGAGDRDAGREAPASVPDERGRHG